MVTIMIGATIILSSIVYVIWPFLSENQDLLLVDSDNRQNQLGELFHQRDNYLETIKELEFDLNTGKLSENDFSELNRVYREKAMRVLNEIDQFGGTALNNKPGIIQGNNRLKCRQCEESFAVGDRFCWNCGAGLMNSNGA